MQFTPRGKALRRGQPSVTGSRTGALRLVGSCAALDLPAVVAAARTKKWEVYIGKPPARHDPDHLLAYLGRYVHRTAISNPRLLAVAPVSAPFRSNCDTIASARGCPQILSNKRIGFGQLATFHARRF